MVAAAMALLAGCVEPQPMPLPLPMANGNPIRVLAGTTRFDVFLQSNPAALGGVQLTIRKLGGAPMDYRDGPRAKYVAEKFCMDLNRRLNPVSLGQFTAVGFWIFEGGCT